LTRSTAARGTAGAPSLSEEALARVKKLRATGEAEHAAGNHRASVDALAEPKKLLGI
jgi:hypothetical protein